MTITPDTKDWTWVLDRPCPDCGLDTRAVRVADIPAMVRANASGWRDVLARPDPQLRPSAQVWSPLEYACHVRDVFVLFDARLHLMLDTDDPLFDNWDQDATAEAERYDRSDAATVAQQLVAAAEVMATSWERVPESAWARPGRRSDGARFTVETFARYFVHDPVHHLHDVTR